MALFVSIEYLSKMEVASESSKSTMAAPDPPSSVTPVLRQFVKEGRELQSRIRQFSSELPPAFTTTKSEFSPVLADFKFLKDTENETMKLYRSNFLKNLYDRSRRV